MNKRYHNNNLHVDCIATDLPDGRVVLHYSDGSEYFFNQEQVADLLLYGVLTEVQQEKSPYRVPGYYSEVGRAMRCNHDFVNMGFMHVKMICRHCNQEKSE